MAQPVLVFGCIERETNTSALSKKKLILVQSVFLYKPVSMWNLIVTCIETKPTEIIHRSNPVSIPRAVDINIFI